MFSQRSIFWLKFLRLPNVLTVPGDVLAGAALALRPGMDTGLHPWMDICPNLAAVALLYLFGMGLNDLVDLQEDRIHRPERPLPSGQLPLRNAWFLTLALAALAVLIAPTPAIFLLLLCVVAYTLLKNFSALLGGLLMGTCRGLALLTGAGFLGNWHFPMSLPPAVWTATLLWTGFIFIVTRLAEREHLPGTPTRLPWLLPFWFTAGLAATAVYHTQVLHPFTYAFLALPPLAALRTARKIQAAGGVRPHHIGACLALLFPLQSAILALEQAWGLAIGILFLLPLARKARRWIPAS